MPATVPAIPINAAHHPPAAPDYFALLTNFSYGLHAFRHTWIASTRAILLSILRLTVSGTSAIADLNIAAFHILPGLMERCRSTKRPRPIELLKSITAAPDFATEIMRLAIAKVPHIRARRERPHQPPNAETIRAEIKSLLAKGKRRLATTRQTALQRRLHGLVDLAPLNGHDLQSAIDALHPDPTDQDILPLPPTPHPPFRSPQPNSSIQ